MLSMSTLLLHIKIIKIKGILTLITPSLGLLLINVYKPTQAEHSSFTQHYFKGYFSFIGAIFTSLASVTSPASLTFTSIGSHAGPVITSIITNSYVEKEQGSNMLDIVL